MLKYFKEIKRSLIILVNLTIKENVKLIRGGITKEDIINACKVAQIYDNITNLSNNIMLYLEMAKQINLVDKNKD